MATLEEDIQHHNSTDSGEGEEIVENGIDKDGNIEGEVVENNHKETEEEIAEDEHIFKPIHLKLAIQGVSGPTEITVYGQDLIEGLRQVLMENPLACFRTCIGFWHHGTRLDEVQDFSSIQGLKDGDTIRVSEDPYSLREAQIHVRRLEELLDSGLEMGTQSLSYLAHILPTDIDELATQAMVGEQQGNKPTIIEEQAIEPDYINPDPSRSSVPLSPLLPPRTSPLPSCIHTIHYSGWNPPPGPQRLKGDLLYLDVTTLEGFSYCITASPQGFYLNCSDKEHFDPTAHQDLGTRSHTLAGLLSQISPSFKKNIALHRKELQRRHSFEFIPTPFQVHCWLINPSRHSYNLVRAHDSLQGRLGHEEHTLGQLRDWNAELAGSRDLPRETVYNRMVRERAIYKVYTDFIEAATQGAQAVLDGNIPALNPTDDEKNFLFIWNNIFFSYPYDGRELYKNVGGDRAAYITAAKDIHGIAAIEELDVEGLHTLATALVDYRGHRVVAQSIVPGILQRDQENILEYGTLDGKKLSKNEKFAGLMRGVGQELNVKIEQVYDHEGRVQEMPSSVECKGIIGTDGRNYLIDLYRITPPDLNFDQYSEQDTSEKVGEKRVDIGHKMAMHRREIVESFIQYKYSTFIQKISKLTLEEQNKEVSEKKGLDSDLKDEEHKSQPEVALEQILEKDLSDIDKNPVLLLATKDDSFGGDTGEKEIGVDIKSETAGPMKNEEIISIVSPSNFEEGLECTNQLEVGVILPDDNGSVKLVLSEKNLNLTTDEKERTEDSTESEETNKLGQKKVMEILCNSLEGLGSISESDFDLRFNMDLTSHLCKLAGSSEVLEKDKKLCEELSEFIIHYSLPRFFIDCLQLQAMPVDSVSLTRLLHFRGINMRYLGRITELVSKREDLSHVKTICISDMIIRVAKRHIRREMGEAHLSEMPGVIVNAFNSLFGCVETPGVEEATGGKKKKSKKKNQRLKQENGTFTTQSMWTGIQSEMETYFGYKLDYRSFHSASEGVPFSKLSILRSLCMKLGVQLLAREYHLEGKGLPFAESDVINLHPVVKHFPPTLHLPQEIHKMASSRFGLGLVKECIELCLEALNHYQNIAGPNNIETVGCYKDLANLYLVTKDVLNSLNFQQKGTFILERNLGMDDPRTLTGLIGLATSCCNAGLSQLALKVLFRARYLLLVLFGEKHPQMATIDLNIGYTYHSVGENKRAVKYLENVIRLQDIFYGSQHVQTGMTRHLLSKAYSLAGEYRQAIQQEKQAYNTFKEKYGEDSEKTKVISAGLSDLTQKAVLFEKLQHATRKEIYDITGSSNGDTASKQN
ncbi:Clustered mitochondria protein-like protein isoform X3 [Oopsacas minuta]|uniref:Clustered mitochondria protein-like protein isoform X3 n=1 Tax=Oopsacas minuta TaxID=111878 RepID=A0AAV7JDE7_9METZ|nr:Clustered mitochondria protein-like protein isoform X3 [Oopsacas minuta]